MILLIRQHVDVRVRRITTACKIAIEDRGGRIEALMEKIERAPAPHLKNFNAGAPIFRDGAENQHR